MNKTVTAVAVALTVAACGGGGGAPAAPPVEAEWTGGVVGVWAPPGQPYAVLILHQGHGKFNAPVHPTTGEWYDLSVVAKHFAEAGYLVVGFEMPPPPHRDGPIERFYRPVLDYIDTVPEALPVYMAGFSGGGWTTTVVTALSPRVKKGYSVQGDAPHNPSPVRCAELAADPTAEDGFEQCNPPYPYRDLYAMAGARLMHVYTYAGGMPLVEFPELPDWPYVVDYTTDNHSWTTWTTEYILTDLAAETIGGAL